MHLHRKKNFTDPLANSEFILNAKGAVYHLDLTAEMIADHIITVGDQDRVALISRHFDRIDYKAQHREFVTHTGTYKGKKITVISSGIGPDNIDIMVNELDAAVNLDPQTRLPKADFRQLSIIRLGTSGALQADIPVDSFLVSSHAIGLDGTAHFYDFSYEEEEKAINQSFANLLPEPLNRPYTAKADPDLVSNLLKNTKNANVFSGITLTAGGFYAPQGRDLVISPKIKDLNEQFRSFSYQNHRICNFEMESAFLFALGGSLGHKTAAILNIITNRYRGEFSQNAQKNVENLIEYVLEYGF